MRDVEQRVQCWFGWRVLPAVARHTGGEEIAAGAVKTHLRGTVGVVVSTCGQQLIVTLDVQYLRFLV